MIRDFSNIACGVLLAWLFFLGWQQRPIYPENVVVIRSPEPCAAVSPQGRRLLRGYRRAPEWFDCHYEARKP